MTLLLMRIIDENNDRNFEDLLSIEERGDKTLRDNLALLMTYLTIAGTAVLVPDTIATIFSNSAFNMDSQDLGWYITCSSVQPF